MDEWEKVKKKNRKNKRIREKKNRRKIKNEKTGHNGRMKENKTFQMWTNERKEKKKNESQA